MCPPHDLRQNSGSSVTSKGSKSGEDSRVVKDAALKIIAKRKVKGNKEEAWEEAGILERLYHENIVRGTKPL